MGTRSLRPILVPTLLSGRCLQDSLKQVPGIRPPALVQGPDPHLMVSLSFLFGGAMPHSLPENGLKEVKYEDDIFL